MQIKARFDHFNIDVQDLQRSIKFYEEALGLQVLSTIDGKNGSFRIVMMGHPDGGFRLELTWLADHPQPFELGENESHLCMRVQGDYDAVREFHRKWICFENHDMNLYFIEDPDGYWIEILPENR